MNQYSLLIQKIDAFIRKYYLNQLIRGVLIFLSCALGIFIILNIGEYFFYFPSSLKIPLLIILSALSIGALSIWIIKPLLQMQKLGKVISRKQAAQIIGTHFANVQDKLLNILQLKENDYPAESIELVNASVEQKTKEIVLVPFLSAIQLNENKRYLKYVLPSVVIIIALLIFIPNLFKSASSRLLQPTVNFEAPAPFHFTVLNSKLEAPANSNFLLELKVDGDKLPDQVFIKLGKETLEMQKKDAQHFSYSLKTKQESIPFQLEAAKVKSAPFTLEVMPLPAPEGFGMKLNFPAYTQMENQNLQSMEDVVVPEGTRIQWILKASHTDNVSMKFGATGSEMNMNQFDKGKWEYTTTAAHDTFYNIYLSNAKMPKSDSFSYKIQVIKDQSPQILAELFKDSLTGQQILITGQASDDYGITEINFVYQILDVNKQELTKKKVPLSHAKGKMVSFQHYFDLAAVSLNPGQSVNYYVEAWDNDGIRGRKRAISEIYSFQQPDGKELDQQMEENSSQIDKSISQSSSQSKELQKQMERMKNQLLQNQSMSWEQEQNMKSMMDQQMQLKNQVEALKKRFEEQQKHTEQKNFSENVKEKQEAIQKQLDRMLNDELAEQLKKLQEMLEQKNRANAMENLQKMQEQNKLFDMNMERIQALMKQLEMQMKLEDMAEKAKQLAHEERALEEKTKKGEKSNDALAKEQQDIQKKLEEMMKSDFDALEKLNKEQQNQKDISNEKEHAKDAKSSMQKSDQQLQNNQSSPAQKSQQDAAESLDQMAAGLAQMAAGMDMEQIDIDIKATRQLLTNLLRFSFDQEALMDKVKNIPVSSPLFAENAKEQKKLKDNANMIRDSLFVLSKRVFQLAPSINKETTELSNHIQKALSHLEDRRVNNAQVEQQYAMANANNLALLLNETLSNLMQSMMQMQASGMGGQSGKPSPGQGNPGKGQKGSAGDAMKDIITGQQKMGKGLQDGAGEKGGQKGNEKGGQSSGSSGNGGEGEMSAEQIAKLAQEQAQLRKQIQELSSLLNSQGIGGGENAKLLKEIQDLMNRTETDLVNRRLGSQMIQRQKDIMTRLLEAEKSIRNQEEDNKRASQSAKDQPRPMPTELERYLKEKQSFFDAYKTAPPVLKPFYKKMTEDYLKQVK